MSVKSKHSAKRSLGGKKEKKKKLEDSEEDIESSEEELDLTKECHPIGYYLNDRAEMIDQMFSVIKGNKLKAMLPPILKDCDIEQLKLQCLDQLLGMSDKRITCILEGENLETSSESDIVESDECDSDENNETTSGSNSERSNEPQNECHNNNGEKPKKRKLESGNEAKSKKLPKPDSEPVEQGKTLLEILELEMRARAIRALLKQSSNEKESDQIITESNTTANEHKEVSDEVVDLTVCEDDEFPESISKELEEDKVIEKKVFNFEKQIEKSKAEKSNQLEDGKSKRLLAELEIRNKLFKKKIYRTRQQRLENEEEEKNSETNGDKGNDPTMIGEVSIKKEPEEPAEQIEVVLEDPEEGEVSSSEDDYPVEIKQEPTEPVEEPISDVCEPNVDEAGVDVAAVENGASVADSEGTAVNKDETEEKLEKVKNNDSNEIVTQLTEAEKEVPESQPEQETAIEETSWRDRWLQKDGVQKLVKSSKIYAKVKKRIAEKSQKAKEESLPPYEVNSDSNSNSRLEMIEGSIEEYERLLSKNGNTQKPGSEDTSTKIPESTEPEKT